MNQLLHKIIIPAAILLSSHLLAQPAQPLNLVVMKGSGVRVDGSTNINNFTCEIANYSIPDTISCFAINNTSVGMKGILNIEINNFNCHNPVMTNDLKKTLKAKDFPLLKIRFISLNKIPNIANSIELLTGLVEIELAGIKKVFDIKYNISSDKNKIIRMQGTRTIRFTDFNLVAPRKLGGMIQTKNELEVMFYLNLQRI